MDFVQPNFFSSSFLRDEEKSRDRKSTNKSANTEQDSNLLVIVPIEQYSGDFFVYISTEAQVLQQTVDEQSEDHRAFDDPTHQDKSTFFPADESKSMTPNAELLQSFGEVTPDKAIAIYQLVDKFR